MEKVNLYADFTAKNQALNNNKAASASVSEPIVSQVVDKKPDIKDKVLKYSGLAALLLVPCSALVSHKMNTKALKALQVAQQAENEKILKALSEAAQASGEKAKSAGADAWKAIALMGGGALSVELLHKVNNKEELSEEEKSALTNAANGNLNNLNDKANAIDWLNSRITTIEGGLITKYLSDTLGFKLFDCVEQRGKFNKAKYEAALEKIKTTAPDYMSGVAQNDKAPLKKGDTIWSVTSEFDPIKDGGLGSVPPEFQNNFEKFGVKVPTFVPMYEAKGTSRLYRKNGETKYEYNNTTFDVDKAAEFTMPAYRGGKMKNEKVEVYVSTHKKVGNKEVDISPLVFIRSKDYFGNFIYSPGPMTEENEKFAFFSKAVYELSKAKLGESYVDNFEVKNAEAYDKFAAPDGLLLNDWQAAPVAALTRYKTGCENAAGALSDEAYEKLSNMRVVSVCHNLMYQGSTLMNNSYDQRCAVSENILNTLFDQYASDIVENADSGCEYNDISNVLVFNKNTGDKNVNFSSMAVHLSDYFVPVSKNYADEITKDIKQSGSLQWALQQRDKNGVLVGITNGNDYKNIGLENVIEKMQNLTGVKLESYNKNTPIDEIMAARDKNKINFYRNYIQAIANGSIVKEYSKGFENLGGTIPPDLTDEELLNTPILTNAGRFVSQKGIKELCQTIKDLYENWDEKYPGKNKPIIYLAGSDGEGGTQRAYIENLKESLPEEDARRIICYHGFAPILAYMASSDYFLMPSLFEPCGLTQGESLGQSTPVIANATGGLVDTIISEGDEQYGILTEKGDVSQEGFAQAVNKGLDIYFNNQDKYKSMVKNASQCDFSWTQADRKGPSYDYMELFGLKRQDLPERSEIK